MTNIKDLVIAITYRCNSRCRMCNIWQITNHESEITAKELANLPSSVNEVNISGGEPFLRTDLLDIVRGIKRNNKKIRIIISSNGFATSLIENTMKDIVKEFPDVGVAFSIDGIGEKHDQIRGVPGGFKRILDSIDKLKALGVDLRLAFTVGDYNYQELRQVYELARRLELELSLAAVHSSDNFFHKQNKLKYKKEIIKSIDWLINKELNSSKPKNWLRAYFAFGLREFLRTGKRILPDYSGEHNAFVDPQGNVYPCDVAKKKIGHIRDWQNIESVDGNEQCMRSWMICTSRQAIKKNKARVMWWIIKNKFLYVRGR